MKIRFSKMHGAGNDFLVISCIEQSFELSPEQIQSLADRHTGIGFDQVLLLGPPKTKHADFQYSIFNADGSIAKHCGNGARCISKYVHLKQFSNRDAITFELNDELLQVKRENNIYHVSVGAPKKEIAKPLSYVVELVSPVMACCKFAFEGAVYTMYLVSFGNPHAVIFCDDIEHFPLEALGKFCNNKAIFPDGVNLGIAQKTGQSQIAIRTYERGCGETLACGTNITACAYVFMCLYVNNQNRIECNARGGKLHVSQFTDGLVLSGDAAHVYDGEIALDSVS